MNSTGILTPTIFFRAWSVFLQEAASFPGRTDAVWRYVLTSTIVIVLSMTLQIPFIAISLIAVFLTGQENTLLTKLSGVIAVLGTTIAVLLSIILLKLTFNYPLLRILGACCIVFCGMYFLRLSKLGPMGFLVALIVINMQSEVDNFNNPEILTRGVLWLWIATTYPIVVTIATNYLFRPAKPRRLLDDELDRQLVDTLMRLGDLAGGKSYLPLSLNTIERGVLTLQRHLSFTLVDNKLANRDHKRLQMRVTTVCRLRMALCQLSLRKPNLSLRQNDLIAKLESGCSNLRLRIRDNQPLAFDIGTLLFEPDLDGALREMAHALFVLAESDAMPTQSVDAAKAPLFAPDAISNPVYARFAFKALLASQLCYVFYTGVQWPGIHTCMLTCIILALPSLGASSHKGILRILGATIGSVTALIATVFVMPHLESVTGLLFLMLPIIALGAWVTAGSPRFSYLGVQFMFCFALALLGRFGPTTDVTEIRDRMIGILIGVFVSMLVFSLLWPEREGSQLDNMLARLIRSIAVTLKVGRRIGTTIERQKEIDAAQLASWSLLAKNRELQARVTLEPSWQYDGGNVDLEAQTLCAQAQELLFSVNWLQALDFPNPAITGLLEEAFEGWRFSVLEHLEKIANQLEGKSSNSIDMLSDYVATLDALCAQVSDGDAIFQHVQEINFAIHSVSESVVQMSRRFRSATQLTRKQ